MWRHPLNRKYVAYHDAAREGPNRATAVTCTSCNMHKKYTDDLTRGPCEQTNKHYTLLRCLGRAACCCELSIAAEAAACVTIQGRRICTNHARQRSTPMLLEFAAVHARCTDMQAACRYVRPACNYSRQQVLSATSSNEQMSLLAVNICYRRPSVPSVLLIILTTRFFNRTAIWVAHVRQNWYVCILI